MGLTTMFTEILLVLSFQIVSGYMYGRIAALVASFMFGMGLASSLAGSRRFGHDPRHLWRRPDQDGETSTDEVEQLVG